MTKLIAIHALHLASAVAGGIDQIEAGKGFVANDNDDVQDLLDRGAVRKPTDEDKGIVYIERPQGTGKKAAVAGTGVGEDLTKLKKAELIALAKAEEIEIDESATNPVLVQAIVDARVAKAGTDELV